MRSLLGQRSSDADKGKCISENCEICNLLSSKLRNQWNRVARLPTPFTARRFLFYNREADRCDEGVTIKRKGVMPKLEQRGSHGLSKEQVDYRGKYLCSQTPGGMVDHQIPMTKRTRPPMVTRAQPLRPVVGCYRPHMLRVLCSPAMPNCCNPMDDKQDQAWLWRNAVKPDRDHRSSMGFNHPARNGPIRSRC